ncbi:MAG: MFS transporter [Gammaproteobacteria bacterium]|nr:MAG: MFS transporter [Gammaproteobacteria bacterium]
MSRIARKYFRPIICPSAVFSVVQQALLVLVPLYILEIGGSMAESAMIIGVKGLGMMLTDVPAGMLLSRIGVKRMMLAGISLFVLSIALMASVPLMPVLVLAAVLQGIAHSAWLVGRIAYISECTEVDERGRVMALSAGMIRIGNMMGPLLAGVLIAFAGYEKTLYLFAVTSLLVILFVLLWVDPPGVEQSESHKLAGLRTALKDNRHSFLTAGGGVVALMLVRSSRTLMLPLIGAALALDEASIGVAISIGAAVDTLLFYPAGTLMDRVGRKPIFIVSLSMLGVGIFMLPLIDSLAGLVLISVLMGIGNGISAGVVMTMGADLAPCINRGNFIGVWRLLSDVGSTSGPMIIGGVLKVASLTMVSHLIGVLGVVGALYVARTVTETHQRN